jgi:hypothetical protein
MPELESPAANPISKEVTDEICPSDELDIRHLTENVSAEKRKLYTADESAPENSGDDGDGRRLKRLKSGEASDVGIGGETNAGPVLPLPEDVQDAIETDDSAAAVREPVAAYSNSLAQLEAELAGLNEAAAAGRKAALILPEQGQADGKLVHNLAAWEASQTVVPNIAQAAELESAVWAAVAASGDPRPAVKEADGSLSERPEGAAGERQTGAAVSALTADVIPPAAAVMSSAAGVPPAAAGIPSADAVIPPAAAGIPPAAVGIPPAGTTSPPAATNTPPAAVDTPPPAVAVIPPAADVFSPAAAVIPPASAVIPPAAAVIPPAAAVVTPATAVNPLPASNVPPAAVVNPPAGAVMSLPETVTPPASAVIPSAAAVIPPAAAVIPPAAANIPPAAAVITPNASVIPPAVATTSPAAAVTPGAGCVNKVNQPSGPADVPTMTEGLDQSSELAAVETASPKDQDTDIDRTSVTVKAAVDQEVTVGKAAAKEQVATVDPTAAAADQETAMDQSTANREETAVNEQLDETASKLLASGISISLIKKKAQETAEGDPPENSTTDGSCPSAESAAKPPVTNALEVGPNISVTMVNRSEAAPSRFTLSLKSQSELLMDPRGRSEDAAGGGNKSAAAGMADTLTVSRVVSRSPSQQQQQQFPSKSAAKSPMLGAHALMSPPLSRPGSIGSSPPIAGGGSGSGFRHNGGGALRSGGGGAVTEQLNAVAAGIADYMVRYFGRISYFHVYFQPAIQFSFST